MPKSRSGSLAVGTYLQRGSAPPPLGGIVQHSFIESGVIINVDRVVGLIQIFRYISSEADPGLGEMTNCMLCVKCYLGIR